MTDYVLMGLWSIFCGFAGWKAFEYYERFVSYNSSTTHKSFADFLVENNSEERLKILDNGYKHLIKIKEGKATKEQKVTDMVGILKITLSDYKDSLDGSE